MEEEEKEEEEEDQFKPNIHQRCWNKPFLQAPSSEARTTVHFHLDLGNCLVGRQPFEHPDACQNMVFGMSTPRINLTAAP
eukprot:2460130-Pyramimonas_sp.AAC.1